MSQNEPRIGDSKRVFSQVQPDMISLDTAALGQLDVKTVQEKMEEKRKQMARISVSYVWVSSLG